MLIFKVCLTSNLGFFNFKKFRKEREIFRTSEILLHPPTPPPENKSCGKEQIHKADENNWGTGT